MIFKIPLDISILTEPDRCLKLYMDVSFDFQVVWSHFVLRSPRYSSLVRSVKYAKRSKPVQPQEEEVNSSHWIESYQISQVVFSSGGVDAHLHSFSLHHGFSHWVFLERFLMRQHLMRCALGNILYNGYPRGSVMNIYVDVHHRPINPCYRRF